MEKIIHMTDKTIMNIDRNSSKGNQLKWFEDDRWYKADYLGYESLSEYLVSRLLEKTNTPEFVRYTPSVLSYAGKEYAGCVSRNFLREGEELISLEKLFRNYRNISLSKEIAELPNAEERIKYVVEGVKRITGLWDFGKYLCRLLAIDTFFLNEDRHMNNIALIYREEKGFRECPVFDNGAALFSDTKISYPLDKGIEECRKEIEAKPFSIDFDEQMDAAEGLYGQQLRLHFTKNDVSNAVAEVAGLYADDVLARAEEVIFSQMRKYKYEFS